VLTSLAEEDLHADGIAGSMRETVVRRAKQAAQAGIAGVVCSPQEVADVRQACPSLLLVVPGVRPAWAEIGDQKRVATPASAIAAGAAIWLSADPFATPRAPQQPLRPWLPRSRAR